MQLVGGVVTNHLVALELNHTAEACTASRPRFDSAEICSAKIYSDHYLQCTLFEEQTFAESKHMWSKHVVGSVCKPLHAAVGMSSSL